MRQIIPFLWKKFWKSGRSVFSVSTYIIPHFSKNRVFCMTDEKSKPWQKHICFTSLTYLIPTFSKNRTFSVTSEKSYPLQKEKDAQMVERQNIESVFLKRLLSPFIIVGEDGIANCSCFLKKSKKVLCAVIFNYRLTKPCFLCYSFHDEWPPVAFFVSHLNCNTWSPHSSPLFFTV